MAFTLLALLLIPALGFPFVYLAGKKSTKAAAIAIAALPLIELTLILTTVPAVLSGPDYRLPCFSVNQEPKRKASESQSSCLQA